MGIKCTGRYGYVFIILFIKGLDLAIGRIKGVWGWG